MNNLETQSSRDYHELFNLLAGSRAIFLLVTVFSSTIELGLSFSILKISSTASSIVAGLFFTTIVNFLVLLAYVRLVKERNNTSIFIIYIIEVFSSVYGVLGIYAYYRYIQEIKLVTISSVIGMIGLADLIIVNIFIGSYFLQGRVGDRLIEFVIGVNILIFILLLFF